MMARKASALDLDGLIMAAPISRDGFSFNGHQMTVIVENHSHERCDSATLYALLTHVDPPPLLTKAGKLAKRQPEPYVDRPGHFYCAQLLHYGLKALKTKDAAKKRLLESYDNLRNLAVPTAIVQLEQRLRAEFKKINDAAVAQYQVERGRGNDGPPAAKKAKNDDSGKAKQPAQSAPAAIIMPAIPPPSRPKQTARKSPPPFPADSLPDVAGAIKPRTKQTAKKSVTIAMPTVKVDLGQDLVSQPRTKQTAKKSGPTVLPTFATDAQPAIKRVKQTARKTSSPAARLKLAKEVSALPDEQRINFLQEMIQELDGEGFVKEKLAALSAGSVKASGSKKKNDYEGQYNVESPGILQQWDCYGDKFELKVAISQKTNHLWGTFEYGIISGVLRSKGSVPHTSDRFIPSGSSVAFTWRGRESGENVITTGDRNTGTIEFLANGDLKGVINSDFGNFGFTGRKVQRQNVVWSMSIRSWKDEWRYTNEDTYECESKSRWGGWGGDPRPDKPEDSDSSVGGGMDSDMDVDMDVDEGRYSFL